MRSILIVMDAAQDNQTSADPPRPLTDRQRSVIERIDRRVPIKVIAQELGVSETRINQHIRALKDIFEAGSLNELVENYRANSPDYVPEGDLSEAVYIKNQLPDDPVVGAGMTRVDTEEAVYRALLQTPGQGLIEHPGEPKVVPGALDGEHAVLARLAVIVGIAFGILAAVVLMVTTAVTLSEALDGKAAVPDDYVQSAQ